MKTTGIVLIIAGLLLTIFTAFSFFTKKKVVDVGKVQISRNQEHNLRWSPLIGIAVAAVGGVLLVVDSRDRKVI